MVKLKIRKIKPIIVEGALCDHSVGFPLPEEYHEMVAPIFAKNPNPAAEVIFDETETKETLTITIPASGEFEADYKTPPPKDNVKRTAFRTRITLKKSNNRQELKEAESIGETAI